MFAFAVGGLGEPSERWTLLARNLGDCVSCVYRKSDSAILVVKPTKDWPCNDGTEALNRPMDRSVLVQRAMGPRFIIVPRVTLQDPAQVPLVQGDDMIGALATDRSDQPFGETVLPRRAWGNGLVPDAHGPYRRVTAIP
jgi:hypothetical protein